MNNEPGRLLHPRLYKRSTEKVGDKLKGIVQKTGVDRQRYRERVVGFGRSEAARATQAAKKKLTEKENGGIIKEELIRQKSQSRKDIKPISDARFAELTVEARKNGALILRGTDEVEKHLDNQGAAASIIGDTILFRKEVCISEVLEETYHFKQNKSHLNDNKPEPLRTYLNEIDAKRYLLDNAKKYKIPRRETEDTKIQLSEYEEKLREYERKYGHE